MFALPTRILALFGLGPKPPKPLLRALIFAEAALAGVSRATLREDGVAFPDFDDAQRIVWCNRNNPCSDRSPSAVREKAICAPPEKRWPPQTHHNRPGLSLGGRRGWRSTQAARFPPSRARKAERLACPLTPA
jgi:hypothetical protein